MKLKKKQLTHGIKEQFNQVTLMNWIPWKGGECPVPKDTLVEVKRRNGETYSRPAGCLDWKHSKGPYSSNKPYSSDIIAYRISK